MDRCWFSSISLVAVVPLFFCVPSPEYVVHLGPCYRIMLRFATFHFQINIPGYKVVFTQHPSNAVRLRVTNGQCCQMGKPRRLPASSDGGGSGAVGSRAGKWLAIYSFGGQISDTPLLCPSQRVNRLLDILCSKYRICLPILLPLSKPLVIAVVDREFFKDLLVVDNEMRVASYQGS